MSGTEIDRDFWKNRLEVGTDFYEREFSDENRRTMWLEIPRVSPRCRKIILEHFGLYSEEMRLSEQREALATLGMQLLPFYLADVFLFGKRKWAILEVARARLSAAELEDCSTSEDHYDWLAVVFRLQLAGIDNLELLFHLDRTQRKGFARMVLRRMPENHQRSVEDLMTPEGIQSILDAYEQGRRNPRGAYCAAVLETGGNYQIFIKRGHKLAFVADGEENTFGYEREWIILEFQPDLRRVHICSVSADVPLELAQMIAHDYFGEPVSYVNEQIVTPSVTVEAFLRRLVREPNELPLVELTVKNCDLDGSPGLRLNDEQNRSLAPSILHFGRQLGDLLGSPESIETIKVHAFKKKRVKMLFEVAEGQPGFIVRYTDQPLVGRERSDFEKLMEDNYDLLVLSTEKR